MCIKKDNHFDKNVLILLIEFDKLEHFSLNNIKVYK